MRVVMMLAVTALAVLFVALATGSTWPAFLVIALALAGIVLLLRDWRSNRVPAALPGPAPAGTAMSADELSPDISTEPGGPSSDARSDQV